MESKKYLKYFLKENFSKSKIGYVILFITSKCNAKCGHCFYWKSLNKRNDLELNEIKKTFASMDRFSVLLLSGGEPFLLNNLLELCKFAHENNRVHQIIIPTNGILTEKIIKNTKMLCSELPDVLFSVNPSVDGMRETHNKIRGVECYDKVLDTIHKLSNLRLPNLQITVNSVLSNKNYQELPEVLKVISKYRITNHNIELLRGNPESKSILLPSISKVKKIHRHAMVNKARQIRSTGIINKIVVLGSLYYQFKLKENVLQGKKLPFVCEAGKSIIVIYSNGDVSACELLSSTDNLRDKDYNLKRVRNSSGFRRQLDKIRDDKCSCTHICFLNSSLVKDWHSLYRIPLYYIKWLFEK